jgi:putative nucleotidyltransferase with HDIG domain
LTAIKKDAHLITHISNERIRDELFKILATPRSYEGIMLLDEIGILDIIFPELLRGKGVSQARPGRHHTTDVFTHNVLSMKECPTHDPIVKFAALLHDVGKPYVASEDSEGFVIFYNHEVVGSKIAKDIAVRLRLSNIQKEKIYTLIRWHMFTVDEHITDSAVRRFIRRVGLENVKDMIDLRIGDRLGGGTQTAESWRLKKFKERLEEQLNPPFSINDLAIDGNDIMEQLHLAPGKMIGDMLKTLFLEVDEDLEKNNKEYLLKRIHELSQNS